jgi:hypothetical protein
MRLSDAIAMGRVLIQLDPGYFLNLDCTKGCAIGMGLAAVDGRATGANFSRMRELWPWLHEKRTEALPISGVKSSNGWLFKDEIGHYANLVFVGRMTLEELIDYVRSVEPAEEDSTPSCSTSPLDVEASLAK